jgi:3-O-methylgallate 3,4-dioxygenase
MAEIVLAMAVPHSGMLGKPAATWLEDGDRDRKNPELWYRNKTWTYPELEAERKGENFERFLTLEERETRSARCTKALAEMARVYREKKIDVAIIIGKDQKEIFVDMTPSIAVYSGEDVFNGPPQRSVYAPDAAVTHKAHPQLAAHLIDRLEGDGFDLTDLISWPTNTWMRTAPGSKVVPHAFGFIYHQIMADNPPPHVPILVNTFYPPTQPSMKRSIKFGQSLFDAVKAWKVDARVALIASGGLSHFVCDETLDARILGYMESFDLDGLASVDDRSYQSGTSEVKLYTSVLVSMAALGAKMNLVDYVPCYRTPAGTGEGMGFFYWAP